MPLPACRMADVPFPNGTVRAESLCRPAADLAVVLAVVLAAILAAILAATLLPTSLLTSLLILSARHLLLASAAACQRGSAHLPVRPLASASAPRVHMNAAGVGACLHRVHTELFSTAAYQHPECHDTLNP